MPAPSMPQPSSSSSSPSTPEWRPPGQDQAAADAESLQRASEQLGDASEAVAQAREKVSEAASEGDQKAEATRNAEQALEAAEEALASASEKMAEAAQGGGDPEELKEAVRAAEEALAAAEEALAAARDAAEQSEELADAGSAGEEEPLPAEEEIPAAGGAESLAAAEDSAGGAESLAGAEDSAGGAESLAGAEDSAAGDGQPAIKVAVIGAQGSLEQAQEAVAGAIRAMIITGALLPGGDETSADGGQNLPAGGVIVLMPGEPGENEKVAQLEGELEETLVVVDGRLLSERNRLASQRSGAGAGMPGPDESADDPGAEAAALLEQLGGGSAGLGEETEEMAEPSPAGSVASTDMDDMGAGKKDSNTVRPGDIPDGVPDGRDDDIVARQIREAAMNETDPVLREKLWREYINYKKGGS